MGVLGVLDLYEICNIKKIGTILVVKYYVICYNFYITQR